MKVSLLLFIRNCHSYERSSRFDLRYFSLRDSFSDRDRPKPIVRRGVLMTMLQQNALTLPLWISKPGER